ncbi:hypothetical protein W97_02415 [Coniosporium apollinis CBS 100218]|uniref:Uncharacterized protein n=1 Tax=Coniosporium apollinis (strain CBS 100218) TaxID=1168221 RepID=R7YMV3_CONA1|nr:uncharacterized protein W97_02415 [Coniosporium apollinis CBS 100218]EON63188.1 hypothetical protein W97_02415 [Coniosporium apollinis CBS 100218]
MSSEDAKDVQDTIQTAQFQALEPEKLHEQLKTCGLTLFGTGNDCVWYTIAHLLGSSVDKVKIATGLSPTPGTSGIHANAVKGLLTSLGKTFYTAESDLRWTLFDRRTGDGFQDVDSFHSLDNKAIGVYYTRQDGSGHYVVYEPVFSLAKKDVRIREQDWRERRRKDYEDMQKKWREERSLEERRKRNLKRSGIPCNIDDPDDLDDDEDEDDDVTQFTVLPTLQHYGGQGDNEQVIGPEGAEQIEESGLGLNYEESDDMDTSGG